MALKSYLIFTSIVCYFPLIVFLLKNISNAKNKNVWYLVLHFFLIVIVLVLRLFDETNLNPININVTIIFITLTFLTYYLYIYNLEKQKYFFKRNLIFAIIIFVIFNLLESYIFSEIRFKIIRFSKVKSISMSNIITYFLLISYVLILTWTSILKTYNKIAKATIEKEVLNKLIIPYTLLISVSFIFSIFPSKILGFNFVAILYFINSVVLFIMAIYLLFNPKLLGNIYKSFSLKKPNLIKSKELLVLNNLLTENQYFLDKTMNLNKFTVICNRNPVQVRKILNANNYNNFKEYLNSFRIYYLRELIDNGFLNTYSIDTAFKKSGFNSHQTMSRTFKKHYNTTAKEYWQKLKKT